MITSKTACAASFPFFKDLFFAWFIFRAVIIPFPIGFFDFTERFNNEINVELHINSKWGVSPFITHPKTTNPSNWLSFLDIITGISKVPGTLIIIEFFLFNFKVLSVPFIRTLDLSKLEISILLFEDFLRAKGEFFKTYVSVKKPGRTKRL